MVMMVTELIKFVYEIKFGIEINHKHDHKFKYKICIKITIMIIVLKFEILSQNLSDKSDVI